MPLANRKMVAVRLNDISLRYGRQWTLIRLSAEIPARKATLITGDNGAGKTTLLRVIATALRPTKGHVEVFGLDAYANKDAVRSRMGMISHNSHLYYDLTAMENLEQVRFFSGLSHTEAGLKAALEGVGLGPYANQMVRTFSAGMKRRLMIARLLLRDPQLVLLDEPFGQLDPSGVTLMKEVIADLNHRGITVLLATHQHELGRSLCDVEMNLQGGEIQLPPTSISKEAN